ncbi:MAG: GntR family transcriptional regulator [Streptosporangiaceae bacterium]
MPIEPPRPQYRQLADLIRNAIEAGEYRPGSELPPEDQLAAEHGVSRATVNRAMLILRGEGVVRVVRGRGTVVRELPVLRRDGISRQRTEVRESGQSRGAFQGELARLGLAARSDVEVAEQGAPADIAGLLAIETGAEVVIRRRRMYAGDVPVQLATSYLPYALAAGTPLAEADPGPGGIYSRLGELGHAPAGFSESVRVRLPESDEAAFLVLDAEQRVLALRRIARTRAGEVVEVNDIVLPAHQWELHYEWQAD